MIKSIRLISKFLKMHLKRSDSKNSSDVVIIGKTVKDKTITAKKIGNGSRKVIIAAALHGNENNVVHLVTKLHDYFQMKNWELPSDVQIYFIPEINLDGLELQSRYNANGVDLNRNWDTLDWRQDTSGPYGIVQGAGGSFPFSEPETRTFSSWLLELKDKSSTPLIVIIYHSAYPPSGLVQPGYTLIEQDIEPNLESCRFAQSFAEVLGYRYLTDWRSYAITGECIHWCATKNIVSFDVELPNHRIADDAHVVKHIMAINQLIETKFDYSLE